MTIIKFPTQRHTTIPPDSLLDDAYEKLNTAIIIGWNQDDMLYFSSSESNRMEILWLLELAKQVLMDPEEDI